MPAHAGAESAPVWVPTRGTPTRLGGGAATQKGFTTECLPAAGGSIVGRNFNFALRRINNLREVSGEGCAAGLRPKT